MKQVEAAVDAKRRVMDFVDAFRKADDDADIEIMLGMSADARPALLVNVAGSNHVLFVTEARKLADVLESAMNASPDDPEAKVLPNLILALRAACDKADRGFGSDT